MRRTFTTLAAAVAFGLQLPVPDARACGGTFQVERAAARESIARVSDHRIVVAISDTMTTLWDQVEFVGDPSEFVWVLPVRSGVTVGVGSDLFLEALDRSTAATVTAPTRRSCGTSGGCGGLSAAGCGADSELSPSPVEDGGVWVRPAVAGPYSVVQLYGEDAGLITRWLRGNGYAVGPDVEPILPKFVAEGFGFVAVRLRPGQGVRSIAPIRVSWRGQQPSLPLRIAQAGAAREVGLELIVIGDRRFSPANFPTFTIDRSTVTWDYARGGSDYAALRKDHAQSSHAGRAFSFESSIELSLDELRQSMRRLSSEPGEIFRPSPEVAFPETGPQDGAASGEEPDGAAGEVDAPPDGEDDAGVVDDASRSPPPQIGPGPAVSSATDDEEIAFGTLRSRRVTRYHATLPVTALDDDLELRGDGPQDQRAPLFETARVQGVPPCSIAGPTDERPLRAAAILGLVALSAVVARRARRAPR
jgi:hypothetical protein